MSEVFCPASLSPSTIAGIASSILLFVAAIATMVCCFMCSCCYLYQRRQQRGRTPYEGKHNYFFLFAVHPEFTTCGILFQYIYSFLLKYLYHYTQIQINLKICFVAETHKVIICNILHVSECIVVLLLLLYY